MSDLELTGAMGGGEDPAVLLSFSRPLTNGELDFLVACTKRTVALMPSPEAAEAVEPGCRHMLVDIETGKCLVCKALV